MMISCETYAMAAGFVCGIAEKLYKRYGITEIKSWSTSNFSRDVEIVLVKKMALGVFSQSYARPPVFGECECSSSKSIFAPKVDMSIFENSEVILKPDGFIEVTKSPNSIDTRRQDDKIRLVKASVFREDKAPFRKVNEPNLSNLEVIIKPDGSFAYAMPEETWWQDSYKISRVRSSDQKEYIVVTDYNSYRQFNHVETQSRDQMSITLFRELCPWNFHLIFVSNKFREEKRVYTLNVSEAEVGAYFKNLVNCYLHRSISPSSFSPIFFGRSVGINSGYSIWFGGYLYKIRHIWQGFADSFHSSLIIERDGRNKKDEHLYDYSNCIEDVIYRAHLTKDGVVLTKIDRAYLKRLEAKANGILTKHSKLDSEVVHILMIEIEIESILKNIKAVCKDEGDVGNKKEVFDDKLCWSWSNDKLSRVKHIKASIAKSTSWLPNWF